MKDDMNLTPLENSVETLRGQAVDLLERAQVFEQYGLVAAKTEDGVLYTRNRATDTTVIIRPGLAMKITDATVTFTLSRPGAPVHRVLVDTAQFTQQQQGALLDRSQPWVSQRESAAEIEFRGSVGGDHHAL